LTELAQMGLPVFGSSGWPISRTVKSGDRSLLAFAGRNPCKAATKLATDLKGLVLLKSAASAWIYAAESAKAKNSAFIRNSVVCVKFCKMVMASVGGVLLLPRSAGVAEA